MITGQDILLLSTIDWDFQWQVPQELAARLGAAGNRVMFVENLGVRAPRLDEARRVLARVGAWSRGIRAAGARAGQTGVEVSSPLILPPFGPGWQRRLNQRLLDAQLGARMRRTGFQPTVVWTFLPTDTVHDLIVEVSGPGTVLVYHCLADFSLLATRPERMAASEQAIAGRSDLLFVSYDKLADRFPGARPQVFPAGVDLDLFHPVPPTPATLPTPIIGFVGALTQAIDLDLLLAMARARPAWSWVCIGAIRRDLGPLASSPNVHLLGQLPHPELPRHIQGFDVAIAPYATTALNQTVGPTKINEYLAMGKPVVSTAIPAVIEFDQRHRVLETAPPEASAFLAAIERALATADDPAAIQRRRKVAAEADWSRRFAQMSKLVAEVWWKKNR